MRIRTILRVGVSVGIAGIILWRVPLRELWSAVETLNVSPLLSAFLCVAAMLIVRFLKWHGLLEAGGLKTTPADAARSLFGGFTLSMLTPGRLGELGRSLFVAVPDRPSTILLNVLDRALDSWGLITFAVASFFMITPRPAAVFAVAVWLAFLPVMLGLPKLTAGVWRLRLWPQTLRAQLACAAESVAQVRTPLFALLSHVSTFLDMLAFFFVLRAFHRISFGAVLATFAWIVTAGGLPLALSGLGAREGAAALLLARFGVPTAAALESALLLYILSSVLPAIVGAVCIVACRERPKLTRLTSREVLVNRTSETYPVVQ